MFLKIHEHFIFYKMFKIFSLLFSFSSSLFFPSLIQMGWGPIGKMASQRSECPGLCTFGRPSTCCTLNRTSSVCGLFHFRGRGKLVFCFVRLWGGGTNLRVLGRVVGSLLSPSFPSGSSGGVFAMEDPRRASAGGELERKTRTLEIQTNMSTCRRAVGARTWQ